MANWEAFLTSPPVPDGKMMAFTLEFRKTGEASFTEDFRVDRLSRDWFKNFVAERLATLNFVHETGDIPVGQVDTTVTPPVVDAARQAYYNDLVLYRRLKFVGQFRPAILQTTQFTNCETRLNQNFQASYLDLV